MNCDLSNDEQCNSVNSVIVEFVTSFYRILRISMGYPTGYSGRMMIPDIWQDYWIPDIPTFFKKLGAGYPAKVDIQADNILSTDIMI